MGEIGGVEADDGLGEEVCGDPGEGDASEREIFKEGGGGF